MFSCLIFLQVATPSASRWDETPGRPKGGETPGGGTRWDETPGRAKGSETPGGSTTPHRGSETPGATPSARMWEATPSHATPGSATPGSMTPGHSTPGLSGSMFRVLLSIFYSAVTVKQLNVLQYQYPFSK